MTVQEAAAAYGISVQSVRAWCRSGKLKARMKKDKQGKRYWVIYSGQVKAEEEATGQPQSPPEAPAASQEPQSPPEAPAASQEPPVAPGGSAEAEAARETEEERWQRILLEQAARAAKEPEEEAVEGGAGFRLAWTPELIEKGLRQHLPKELWERYGVLIWVWCQVAPEFMPQDISKAGKYVFYGVPAFIGGAEYLRISRARKAAAQGAEQ